MAGRVAGWLLTSNMRTGPGGRVSMGDILRDKQPWRFPMELYSMGMALLVESEPGPHELGFAMSLRDEVVAEPLIFKVDLAHPTGWVFLERGPHVLPAPGVYTVEISMDGEMARSDTIEFTKLGA